jgi:hypothetical protein
LNFHCKGARLLWRPELVNLAGEQGVYKLKFSVMARILLAGIFLSVGFSQTISKDEDRVVANYALSTVKIARATAAQKGLNKLFSADPSLLKSVEITAEQKTLDQQLQRFSSNAKVLNVIRSSGITPRDFGLTMMASTRANMLLKVKNHGPMPPGMAELASTEQMAFVAAHQAAVTKMLQESVALVEK